jgi:8-oxo-dGTP diphosphatase
MDGLKKVASMVILRNGKQYLLLKRANDPNKGKFLPVGGKIAPFETPVDCAIRETFEETGISINRPTFFGMLTETSPMDYNWISYIYLAEIEDMTPPYCDEGELVWIAADMLGEIDTPPTDLHVYKCIDKNRKFILNATYDKDLNLVEMWEELSGEIVFQDYISIVNY